MLSPFLQEFCAPVVVVTCTGEAEDICLKNGLLLHEMLSSFGHLDGINATIRSGSQNFHISDAQIRFERETEVRAKTSANVEALLKDKFEDFDIQRLPGSIAELRSATPSAWTPTIEQIVMRSMSFSEFEMISHPLVLMTVVSTTDIDAIACMQQLASPHHTPSNLLSGQYDPDVHRVYLLIHDASLSSSTIDVDAASIYRRLQSKFPTAKFLALNSLPATAPNLQQPDMWSRWIIPKFFPQDAPQQSASVSASSPPPTNPINGLPVLGARLSMEDFMALRDFCVSFFHKEVIPALERRINFLTKQVNEARKGVKNVLKSFWRKPREASTVKGALRYTHDRIETQILLLADMSFVIKDYETAASMYRLAKDDYKSDKSTLHLAHVTFMLAACHLLTDLGRGGSKEFLSQLDGLREVMQQGGPHDPPHAFAFFALLAGELYISQSVRAPLIAAEFLLQAAASASRQPLLCSLLTEKAASYFLQAGQKRKFAFHTMLAGHKMHPCCPRARKHALVCFVVSMMIHEGGRWNGIKSKLQRCLVEELKLCGLEGGQRALLFLLRMLAATLSESQGILSKEAATEAAAVLGELLRPGPWGNVILSDEWARSTTRGALLGPLPTLPAAGPSLPGLTQVPCLAIPNIEQQAISLMVPTNGPSVLMAHDAMPTAESQASEELRVLLALELQWGLEQELEAQNPGGILLASNPSGQRNVTDLLESSSPGGVSGPVTGAGIGPLAERWVRAELELQSSFEARRLKQQVIPMPRIPLGERVFLRVSLNNKLPVDLSVSQLQLEISPSEGVSVEPLDVPLPPNASKDIFLSAAPSTTGTYRADSLKWSLSPTLQIRQPLLKPGSLLQKTLQQRATNERGPPAVMGFEIVEAHPLLHVALVGCSPEVLQGELVRASIVLTNHGGATACSVNLKFSQPCCVILQANSSNASDIIPPWGQSSTVVRLPPGTVIIPGGALTLDVWLRFNTCGRVQFSALASYCAQRISPTDGGEETVPFGPGLKQRTSFTSCNVLVAGSVSLQVYVADRPSSTEQRTLVLHLSNTLATEDVRDRSVQMRSSIAIKSPQSADDEDALVGSAVYIEGIYMLGAALPVAMSTPTNRAMSAGPTERVTLCLPINLSPSSFEAGTASAPGGHMSWLLPLSKKLSCNLAFLGVITRSLCSLYSTVRLNRLLREARLNHKENLEEEAPKTIQQVRREQQQTASSGDNIKRNDSQGALSVFEFNGSSSSANDSSALSLSSSSQETLALASCRGIPTTDSDLADVEGRNGSINLTVVWACKWKGQIRRGIHSISQIPLYSGIGLLAAVRTMRTDLILVGVTHPDQASLSPETRSVRVPVLVELRSVADEPLTISISAIDFSQPPNCVASARWEGKTGYVDVQIAPRCSVTLPFYAVLTSAGVYDLKRFLVRVASPDGTQTKPKPFADNSFVTVVQTL